MAGVPTFSCHWPVMLALELGVVACLIVLNGFFAMAELATWPVRMACRIPVRGWCRVSLTPDIEISWGHDRPTGERGHAGAGQGADLAATAQGVL